MKTFVKFAVKIFGVVNHLYLFSCNFLKLKVLKFLTLKIKKNFFCVEKYS